MTTAKQLAALEEAINDAREHCFAIRRAGDENLRRAQDLLGEARSLVRAAGWELSYGDMTYTDACFVLGLPTNRSYCALADMAQAQLDGLAEGAPGVLRAACRKLIDAVTMDTTPEVAR